MPLWVRFEHAGKEGFGTLQGGSIIVHHGDMFAGSRESGEELDSASVTLLAPSTPSKMICMWNNFHAVSAKLEIAEPDEPHFLLKAPSAFIGPGATARRPKSYDGPVVYEGELGIVIGRQAKEISESQAAEHVFGYTCVNDITAARIVYKNPDFPQWTRAKSFDTFGAFGPCIADAIDPMPLSVRTVLNGEERQNYPVSDMVFSPHALVAALSRDMTLMPGDVIACGTSLGVGVMEEAENRVDVTIEGIGTLSTIYVN